MNQELKTKFSDFDEKDVIRFRESAEKEKKSIVESVNLEKVFGIHPSTKLQELYKRKYWQGQVPDKAKIIFLGLDANWDMDIEKNEAFPKIEEYLNDGVAFWKRHGVHHPFLLPGYRKKNGYKYHQGFSKLGINKEDADKISFIELINIPTFGTSTKGKKEYMNLINSDYLKSLNDIIFDCRKKIVFLSKTLYDDILRIRKKSQYSDIFNFGLTIDMKTTCKNRLLNIHNIGNTFIFVSTHFSTNITNEHIANMATVIKSFLKSKKEIWWRITYIGSWNGELVEEIRYIPAKDVFEVKKIMCKYLNPFRVERDFIELEFKPVSETSVDRQWIWK